MTRLLQYLFSTPSRLHTSIPPCLHAPKLPRLSNYLLLLLLLTSPSLLADKLDSLLRIHDTATIVFYQHQIDSLALANFHTIRSTRITGFQRYNPLDRNKDFYATFSNVGLAHRNLLFQPDLSDGFHTGLHSFDAYRFTNENTRYYRHLIPVTYLSYDNGSLKEQLFRVIHSHTIARKVTIGVDFSLINSPGSYYNQKSDDKSVVFTGQYFSKDLRFGAIANYRYNKFIVLENGGIVNDTIFEEKLETDTRLIDVNLNTAQNLVKESGVFANTYFYISRKPEITDSTKVKPKAFHAGRIAYSFDFKKQTQIYSDQDPLVEFYQLFDPVLDSNETYDSLSIRTFDNYFSWSNLRMGENISMKPLLVMFAIRNQQTTYSDSVVNTNFSNWIPEAFVVIRPYRNLTIDLSATFTLGDFNNAGFKLKGTATQQFNLKNNKSGSAAFYFLTSSSQAGYLFSYFRSNYFRWDTAFSHQKILQAGFKLSYAELQFKLDYNLVGDHVYLNQEARPVQHQGTVNVITASLKDEFRFKKWSIDASLVYQYVSDKNVIRLPDFMARVSIFPTLPLFQNAAVLQPGIDLFYNTAYFADAYMPALRMFYLQDEKKIGNYVYADLFINLMIKRFRIFAKYQHLNSLWSQRRYYMVPHYPMQDAVFKFGLSWSFYD